MDNFELTIAAIKVVQENLHNGYASAFETPIKEMPP